MEEQRVAVFESRRERLKQARAERILTAAAGVFAEKGFRAATIREIAQRADVAEGTIYNYFTDKRDLLLAMTRQLITDATTHTLAEFAREEDRAFMTAVLNERFVFFDRNFHFLRALLIEVWTDSSFRQQYLSQIVVPLLDVMEGYLKMRVQDGRFRPVNSRVIVRAILGSFLSFLLFSEAGQKGLEVGVSREELVQELVDFFLLGLQARSQENGD